jgi:protein-tyrosine phosphatase
VTRLVLTSSTGALFATMLGIVCMTSPQGCYEDCCPPPSGALPTEPTRWIDLPGVLNARDLGGYAASDGRTVRWRQVYRSAELEGLTEEGCRIFADLGIKAVIDLRNRLLPSPLFGGDAPCVFCCAEMHLLPVKGIADESAFESALEPYAESFGRGIELLADPERLPLLFHCGGGNHRAGVFAALLLSVLGVDREDIVDDFMLSPEIRDPAPLVSLLDYIDGEGGIEAVAASLGVSEQTLAAVRENLLE